MNPEKTIRVQAKATLSNNNWPASVGVILTLGVTIMAIIYLSDALTTGIDYLLKLLDVGIFENVKILPLLCTLTFTLVGLYFMLPLLMGSVRFMYLMSKTSDADFSEMFHYFRNKRYFKSLKTYTGLILRCTWQAAISFIPATIFYLYATSLSAVEATPKFSILWYFVSYMLMVGGVLFFNILTAKKFLAIYYYIENDNLSVSDICRLSEQYMQRFGSTTAKLNTSLLPVNLSCLLIIPALFVLPYVMTAKATSAKWIIELSKQTDNKDE